MKLKNKLAENWLEQACMKEYVKIAYLEGFAAARRLASLEYTRYLSEGEISPLPYRLANLGEEEV